MKIFKILPNIISAFWKEWKLSASIPKPENCLIEMMTVRQAESYFLKFYDRFKEYDYYDSLLKEHGKWISRSWQPFILQIKEGDELWLYRMPETYWKHLKGKEGFIILRGKEKKSIAQVVFVLS